MHTPAAHQSLDGRKFVALEPTDGGEVGPGTVFEYHEENGDIWASYSGGTVVRGFLVGTRDGNLLNFRYSQLSQDRETSSGRCESEITTAVDGRLRLNETWSWETRPGSGVSVVEEVN